MINQMPIALRGNYKCKAEISFKCQLCIIHVAIRISLTALPEFCRKTTLTTRRRISIRSAEVVNKDL